MSESITDAKDCIIKIDSNKAGGTDGQLIITDFSIDVNTARTRKYGVGNRDAQGRTEGNREVDVSFTHEGEHTNTGLLDAFDSVDGSSGFDVVLEAQNNKWELTGVAPSDFSVSVGDEDFTLEFNGTALGYSRVSA